MIRGGGAAVAAVMILAITRLRVRSFATLPAFLHLSGTAVDAACASPGFRDGLLFVERWRSFWTLTRWADGASLQAFVRSPAHAAAMRHLAALADEAASSHGDCTPDEPLDERRAHAGLARGAVFYALATPSPDHAAGTLPPLDPVLLRRRLSRAIATPTSGSTPWRDPGTGNGSG